MPADSLAPAPDPAALAASRATDFTSGPIAPALLRLALPVLASQALRIAYQWVDALWVSSLGVAATASVTTSLFVFWWVYALNDIVAVGVVAYVAQLLGAGQRGRAGVAAYKALRGSALLGLPALALGLLGGRALYRLLGATPEVVAQGGAYLSIILSFAPLPMMALTCEGIMRGSGDTRTPLLIDLGAVGLNAVLDPLLIFGLGPFPRLGVAGAAWATVIAQGTMLGAYLACAARGHRAFPLRRQAPGDPVRVAGLLRVGVPVASIGMLFSLVYLGFARIAADFGPAAMAVVGVVNRIEALSFIFSFAIGSGAAVLVGHNLGARQPGRAERAIRTGVRWGTWFSVALMLVLLAWPQLFLRLFSPDPGLLRVGVPYLRILSLCLWNTALEIVTAEAVFGSGHTRALSAFFGVTSLLRLPLAAAVSYGTPLGPLGIAWTITVTCIARSLVIWSWFKRGTWKRGLGKEVHGAGAA